MTYPLMIVDPKFGDGELCAPGHWTRIYIVADSSLWGGREELPTSHCLEYSSGSDWRYSMYPVYLGDYVSYYGYAVATDPEWCWKMLHNARQSFLTQRNEAEINLLLVDSLLKSKSN